MTFWKIAMSALLALTWSLPAFAAHGDRRQERVDVRIEGLAHELEESARHIDRRIRDAHHGHHDRNYNRNYDRDAKRAIRAVHELKDAAKHFHKQVERNRSSVSHLSRDIDRVAHAYETAVYKVDRAHLSGHLRRDLATVGQWIDRISDRCGASRGHASYNDQARFASYDRYDRRYPYNRPVRHDPYTRGYGKQSDPYRGFSISWKSPWQHYRH